MARAYVIVTGVLFALITIAHLARMIWEDRSLAAEPWFACLTLLTAGLTFWSWKASRTFTSAKPACDLAEHRPTTDRA